MLASSQSELERQRLRDEMISDSMLSKILRQLDSVKVSCKLSNTKPNDALVVAIKIKFKTS